jgi:hypothetical protein
MEHILDSWFDEVESKMYVCTTQIGSNKFNTPIETLNKFKEQGLLAS